jgi:hypothetical protein
LGANIVVAWFFILIIRLLIGLINLIKFILNKQNLISLVGNTKNTFIKGKIFFQEVINTNTILPKEDLVSNNI